MLAELRIQNFAIIDQLEVMFTPGFNVITGETGAGKSIIIDAVELVLGGRADSDFIRAGSEKAQVEATFRLSKKLYRALKPLLEAESIELEKPDEITLIREMRSNGRNTCRVSGTTVNLQFYREIGAKLVDIHGQSEHLSLLKPSEHLSLLDRYADVVSELSTFSGYVESLNDIRHELRQLLDNKAAIERRAELLKYQVEEIRAVDPEIGEDEALREESERLANFEQLSTLTGEIQAALDGEDETVVSAVPLLTQVEAMLSKLAKIDPRFVDLHDLATEIAEQATELARDVNRLSEGIEFNPRRLNDVEDRIDAINRLKKKYGGDIQAVLTSRDLAQRDLDSISNSTERIEQLRQEEHQLLAQLGELAERISRARQAAGTRLSAGVEKELADLKMDGAHFETSMIREEDPEGCIIGDKRYKFNETGIDTVEFMMAANKGEPLRPVAKVASGGETARIMLALKGVLSRADETPTLIFDEIDQGIGGRVGSVVGIKLWSLSDGHQVICITHLAQLAGFGDSHFKVAKAQRGDRTTTTVTVLSDKARVEELAEMLGAETTSAKQSAHDILMLARRTKESVVNKGMQEALL